MSVTNYSQSIMDELSKRLMDEISREIDTQVLCDMMRQLGRLEVVVDNIDEKAAGEWCREVLHVASWASYGKYWFFDDIDDVALFILKWGGQHVTR